MFNLYFAGSPEPYGDTHIIKNNGHRLFSFLDGEQRIKKFEKEIKENNSQTKLFIDSGAFSVAHKGAKVDLDKYIEFINNHSDFGVFAQLDTIPFPVLNAETAKESAEKSWENYVYMLDRLDHPEKLLYVFHFGESDEHFDKVINTEVNGKLVQYIGLGGRHGVSTEEQDFYFKKKFMQIKQSKNPNLKVHAFGMTILSVLERYPFYSADSTTWLMLAINGAIMTEYGILSVSEKLTHTKEHILNQPEKIRSKYLDYIASKGYTYEQVSSSYKYRKTFNIDYLLDWCKNYKCKHDFSGIKRLISYKP